MLKNGRYIVNGSNKLEGEVQISGAKNAALPIICASMLSDTKVTLLNVPKLNDVYVLISLLETLGAKIDFNDNVLEIIPPKQVKKSIIEREFSEKIRYSILMLGVLLSKSKSITMCYPGGCNLGKRPIDIHLEGLELLGVNFEDSEDRVIGETLQLRGAEINLRFPSVGATENLIIAAVKASGVTYINNAAREPEIDDLCMFLNSMGAKISGIGTKTLEITGVDSLLGVEHTIISDRVETATFMAAAAITESEITIKNTRIDYLFETMKVFQKLGCTIELIDSKSFKIKGVKKLHSCNIETAVYPELATDVQPLLCPLLALSDGTSKVIENIYKERFAVAQELIKMGAKITFDGINSAEITGVNQLLGTTVKGADLRSGAGLVIAGLAATGTTIITNAYQINRGYEDFEEKLLKLGADIRYVVEE